MDNPIIERLLDRFGDKLHSLAVKSDVKYAKHAAVLLDTSLEPICYGYNRNYTHAEEIVLAKWMKAYRPRGRKPYMIFIVRIRGKGIFPGFNFSKPCEDCEELIENHGLEYLHT
jgi:hypothetical protein